jgi:hypothetical protein
MRNRLDRSNSTSSLASRIAVLVACAGVATSFTGCDQRSETARKVESASREVRTLTAGSPVPAQPDAAKAVFTKVSTDLEPVSTTGSDGENAAAQVLIAQSNLSLGTTAAGEAARLERDARNLITLIGSDRSSWSLHNAVASAADSYDPSAEITRIDAEKSAKDKDIAEQQARRGQVETKVNDLAGRAKQQLDAADEKEAEYARRMQSTVKMSATQAAPVVEAANVIKREADELRLAGSKLQAQADEVSPLLGEIDAVISQLTNQKAHLEASKQSLLAQKEAARAEATAARADAAKAAAAIEESVAALTAKHTGEIEEAYSKAASLLNKAAQAAQKSQQASPGGGKLAVGQSNLALADLHWQKALGLRSLKNTLDSLAKTTPALPKSSEYASLATQAGEKEQEALSVAKERLPAAGAAFGSANVGAPSNKDAQAAKERLQNLSTLIEAATKVVEDDSMDLSAARASLAAVAAADAAPAPEAPPEAPVAAAPAVDPELSALIDAALSALREQRLADFLGMTDIFGPPDAACRSKFGKSFVDVMGEMPIMGPAMQQQFASASALGLSGVESLTAADLTVTQSGDTATATASALPTPMTFAKLRGKWYVSSPQIAQQAPMIVKVFEEFATAVEAGEYPDSAAAAVSLQQKLMAAAGGTAPPPPGGG